MFQEAFLNGPSNEHFGFSGLARETILCSTRVSDAFVNFPSVTTVRERLCVLTDTIPHSAASSGASFGVPSLPSSSTPWERATARCPQHGTRPYNPEERPFSSDISCVDSHCERRLPHHQRLLGRRAPRPSRSREAERAAQQNKRGMQSIRVGSKSVA